jgi:hypothetical protein
MSLIANAEIKSQTGGARTSGESTEISFPVDIHTETYDFTAGAGFTIFDASIELSVTQKTQTSLS